MGNVLLKKIKLFRRYKWILKNANRDDQVPPPLVYKLVLTYKCNLRCQMCFQWGDQGWCDNDPAEDTAEELDWGVVERLLKEVGRFHPNFILTGGEPLLYTKFRDLAGLLQRNKCHTIICNNGTQLNKYPDVIADNPYISYLVSLDGLEPENDAIRGKGVYKRVVENIKKVKSLQKPPHLGIQFTVRPENVSTMFSFCIEMAKLGVDWILFNPFWFVTDAESERYAGFMKEHFDIQPNIFKGFQMPYDIDCDAFVEQYTKIKNKKWPFQISSYFKNPEDIRSYTENPDSLIQNNRCYKQWVRVDITPSGDVSPCIQFPDLIVGNLKNQSLMEIWNSPSYSKFREVIRTVNLPICSKCNNIYLYDAKRKYL